MKFPIQELAIFLAFAISTSSLSARLIRIPDQDELAEHATLICNGVVESIIESGTNKDGEKPWGAVTYFSAKIKVLHVFKNNVPPEIEIKYRSGPADGTDNGPIQIQLATGVRYRFFLKNDVTAASYVGVLDGQFDDGFAVVPLDPKESDDSSYISKSEAIEIATKWLEAKHPELPPIAEEPSRLKPDGKPIPFQLMQKPVYPCVRLYPRCGMNDGWQISVSVISANGAITASKRIAILGDRTVDEQQWDKPL